MDRYARKAAVALVATGTTISSQLSTALCSSRGPATDEFQIMRNAENCSAFRMTAPGTT